MINVFLRVYFDVFCQNSRFYFPSSKQSYFYVLRVFVDSRGRGGPLINVLLSVYFDVFVKLRDLMFAHQNRLRSMFLVFL